MGIIESPPKIESIIVDVNSLMKVMRIGQIPELQSLIRKACDQYFYWSEVSHRIPAGVEVKAEEVWAYLKYTPPPLANSLIF